MAKNTVASVVGDAKTDMKGIWRGRGDGHLFNLEEVLTNCLANQNEWFGWRNADLNCGYC